MESKTLQIKIFSLLESHQSSQTKDKKRKNYPLNGDHVGFLPSLFNVTEKFLQMIVYAADISSQEEQRKVGTNTMLTGCRL